MKKIDIVFSIISLITGAIAFVASNNIFLLVGTVLVFELYYFVIVRKLIKKYLSKVNTIHCCYHFINSFIITLSVKESLDDAYESGIRLENKEFNEETANLESMPIYDRIVYLRKYFNLAVYKMFVNILDLYQDQGGNILNISDALMRETTRTEKALADSISTGEKHLFEFAILWSLTFLILIFLRFGISEFYMTMLTSPLFMALLVFFFVLIPVSIHIFLVRFSNITIKEDSGI